MIIRALIAIFLLNGSWAGHAYAQTTGAPRPPGQTVKPGANSNPSGNKPTTQADKRAELDSVSRQITLTQERQLALRDEINDLDKDRATLNAMLIGTSDRARRLEGQLDLAESNLRALTDREAELQASLRGRRAVLADVLAALQRMGRQPVPAVVVRPQDALQAVRSAILLGAVVPDIHLQAEAVSIDLRQLSDLHAEIAKEEGKLRVDATTLAEEERRIELLLAQKRRAQNESETALEIERRKSAELAQRAGTLKELIAGVERDGPGAASAASSARKVEEARTLAAKSGSSAKPTSLGLSDRIAPAIAFADAKRLLPKPANGTVLRLFGEDDGFGGRSQGISLATRSGARVSSPADGWVVFAGPFRSYGQLLIINAGDGYHILLAGMDRIDAGVGQFVLAGEPVAEMGDHRLASIGSVEAAESEPVLYIEFRKDANAVDPGPWWAGRIDEKAG